MTSMRCRTAGAALSIGERLRPCAHLALTHPFTYERIGNYIVTPSGRMQACSMSLLSPRSIIAGAFGRSCGQTTEPAPPAVLSKKRFIPANKPAFGRRESEPPLHRNVREANSSVRVEGHHSNSASFRVLSNDARGRLVKQQLESFIDRIQARRTALLDSLGSGPRTSVPRTSDGQAKIISERVRRPSG